MPIKTSQILVAEAYAEVKTIDANQALSLVKENKCNLIAVFVKISLIDFLVFAV